MVIVIIIGKVLMHRHTRKMSRKNRKSTSLRSIMELLVVSSCEPNIPHNTRIVILIHTYITYIMCLCCSAYNEKIPLSLCVVVVWWCLRTVLKHYIFVSKTSATSTTDYNNRTREETNNTMYIL